MLIAHGPIGFLANEIIQKKNIEKLSTPQYILITIASIFFGILPDFDLFILLALSKPSFLHHQIVTHTPFFWIIVFILSKVTYTLLYKYLKGDIKKFLTKDFINTFLNTMFIATLFHLLADLTTGYIQFLYPFTKHGFTLLFLPINVFAGARLHPMFALEIIITALFTLKVIQQFFIKKVKVINFMKFILIPTTVIYFIISVTLYTQTYTPDRIVFTDDHLPLFDQDFDGLVNSKDSDIDSDGIDNIQDINQDELFKAISTIGRTEYYPTVPFRKEDRTDIQKLLYLYGAQDSYRLIEEVYLEINSPISPVISANKPYSSNLNNADALYNYFQSIDELLDITINTTQINKGKIIFFLNQGEIVNMGITINDNSILTSLGEIKIKVFSLQEVLENDIIDSIQIQK